MIVNNDKTKKFFAYTLYIIARASLLTRYRKILISWDQLNYIGTLFKAYVIMLFYALLSTIHTTNAITLTREHFYDALLYELLAIEGIKSYIKSITGKKQQPI